LSGPGFQCQKAMLVFGVLLVRHDTDYRGPLTFTVAYHEQNLRDKKKAPRGKPRDTAKVLAYRGPKPEPESLRHLKSDKEHCRRRRLDEQLYDDFRAVLALIHMVTV